MKKTLIALVVAASAAVPGAAMAWTPNGSGGSVDLGGTLTPTEKVTPWEVQVGTAVSGLDAPVQKGQKIVDITMDKAFPVLGIRTQNNQPFQGQAGISPQIDFHKAVDVAGFCAGVTTLTLDALGADGAKIGTMSVPFSAAAMAAKKASDTGASSTIDMIARDAGDGFYGGIAQNVDGLANNNLALANALSTETTANFNNCAASSNERGEPESFSGSDMSYSGFYSSGIETGKSITLTLDNPAESDEIKWKAALPVTVTYS